MSVKLLIGGSPCTFWSIAQSPDKRETEPNSGLGWELFENYLIARDKYKPDYFLYENNYSMSKAIRAEITRKFGFEPIMINSALLSAQNRKRLYWVGKRNSDGTYSKADVQQPEDKGILLRDILETGGQALQEKSYCLTATESKGANLEHTLNRHVRTQVAEQISLTDEPATSTVRVGTIENNGNGGRDSQPFRVYSTDGKSTTLLSGGGGVGAKTGLYATPVAGRMVGRRIGEDGHRDDYNEDIAHVQQIEINLDPDKTNCLTTVQKDNMVIESVYQRVSNPTVQNALQKTADKYGYVPTMFNAYNTSEIKEKSPTLSTGSMATSSCATLKFEQTDGKEKPVYEVRDGLVTIKDKQYPIKLRDGSYIIRKLTVNECKKLQTVPDWYDMSVISNSQCYKCLGNGWTCDVISHILSHMNGLTNNDVEVLSMYDGMSCGRIALKNLGVNVVKYYASEIDKYAIKVTMHNFPDIIQLGDAYDIRTDKWKGTVYE